MAHLLSVQGLVTTFRNEGKEFNAIEGVNLHVDRGEIVGIVGESGSRSEEHTSELQSRGLISYAVSCLKKNRTFVRIT